MESPSTCACFRSDRRTGVSLGAAFFLPMLDRNESPRGRSPIDLGWIKDKIQQATAWASLCKSCTAIAFRLHLSQGSNNENILVDIAKISGRHETVYVTMATLQCFPIRTAPSSPRLFVEKKLRFLYPVLFPFNPHTLFADPNKLPNKLEPRVQFLP